MKKMGMLLAALIIAVSCAGAQESAELGMYGKLTAGYRSGSTWIDPGTSYSSKQLVSSSGFEVQPTFGLRIPYLAGIDLAVEGSVGLAFGGHDYSTYKTSTVTIVPGIMGLYNYHFTGSEALAKLVPYAGAGVSLPIAITSWKWNVSGYEDKSDTDIGFKVNMLAGARYDINDTFAALAEFSFGFIGTTTVSFRAGAVYNIK